MSWNPLDEQNDGAVEEDVITAICCPSLLFTIGFSKTEVSDLNNISIVKCKVVKVTGTD
jgi:hypothetical protein